MRTFQISTNVNAQLPLPLTVSVGVALPLAGTAQGHEARCFSLTQPSRPTCGCTMEVHQAMVRRCIRRDLEARSLRDKYGKFFSDRYGELHFNTFTFKLHRSFNHLLCSDFDESPRYVSSSHSGPVDAVWNSPRHRVSHMNHTHRPENNAIRFLMTLSFQQYTET
ncbi:hypothetical protein EVAR_92125_1 [Eumeta japonica]|uniref:Uncharacterized protein n=1 Tax=Eumeta variegata TaxID=151549 RepID=A0A4C1SZ83_EUMVA|nr:hypothetical protein EVAR_92125_1 [Eumeta japonica]